MNAISSLRSRMGKRGFTLVELMIVVAIIGVLAALAIYGVRLYLAQSKTAEAKTALGGISRGATQAFEREYAASEALGEGAESAEASHSLCESAADPVPAGGPPAGRKYQPNTADGQDFQAGDRNTGWQCLNFSMSQPHYYQYFYTKDNSLAAPGNPALCTTNCYEAGAVGDLDADATVFARFALTGAVNTATGKLKTATQVYVENEFE